MAGLPELNERLTDVFDEWLREDRSHLSAREIGKGLGCFIAAVQRRLLTDAANTGFERGFADMLGLQTYAHAVEVQHSREVH